jgi:hypothetical protein
LGGGGSTAGRHGACRVRCMMRLEWLSRDV